MKNITAIRCLLMLPVSCIASGLLMLIGSRLGNLFIFPSALLFLATFEFIMPIKSIWLRGLNVLFGLSYIAYYSQGLERMFGSDNLYRNSVFNIDTEIFVFIFAMAALAYVLVISFVKDKQENKK